MTDIHTAGGIIIQDRKILMTRAGHFKFFTAPGGSIEADESPEDALVRELKEELDINVTPDDLTFYGTFTAEAVNHPGRKIIMELFMVEGWRGNPAASSEVADLTWLDSQNVRDDDIGSIFAKQVIPRLQREDKID